MTTPHSPAPWSQDPEGEVAWTIEDANGIPICDAYIERDSNDDPTPESDANARLIAAAPELLATLIDCEGVLDSANRATNGTCNAFRLVLEKVRTAITAATA